MAPKRPEILGPDAEQHRISVNRSTWTRTIVAAAQDRTTASAIVELALQEWLTVRGR
jgi:hypothetical protein